MALKKVNSDWLDSNLTEIADALESKGIPSPNPDSDNAYRFGEGANDMAGAINAITERNSNSLSVIGRTVSVPAGYYASTASKSVSSSYIIPSGTKTISSAGTHDVTSYAKATIASNLVDTSAGTATAAQILSGKIAYVDGSKITGSMTDRGTINATIQPGEIYTIPAGYHSGSGKITAANGYALSGTWKLTASTVYTRRQSSTLTASDADCSLEFGDEGGVQEGIGLTFNSSGMQIGNTLVFSYYQYTTYGIGWACELDADTYPDAYLEFNQACTVSEAFYNYFTSIATQTGSDSGSSGPAVSTGTLQLNAIPGESQIWVPRLNNDSITYGHYTSGNQSITNVILNAPFFIYMGAPDYYFYEDTSGVTDIGSDLSGAGYYVGVLTSSSGSVRFWDDCCFEGESRILMADNTEKALVDVAIGDIVMTYDEITGASAANEVTALGTVKLNNSTELTLEDGTVIRMNVYHPMWTEEGWKSIVGYKGMPRLTAEDKLLNNNGEYVAIKSIEEVEIEKETYYTIKVANNNNFYVNGYLAQGKDKD